MLSTKDLFKTIPEAFAALFDCDKPWGVLPHLDDFVKTIEDNRQGNIHPSAVLEGNIYLARDAEIGPHVYIQGPAWIGNGAKVKHGAYLRGGVVLADGAEVGAKTEVKRTLFLTGAKAAHLNYVGDSVLGYKVNLGAGVKLANFKTDGSNIKIQDEDTGFRKLGALLGDRVSIGCNAVTVPGTVIGADSSVYNCAMVRGFIPANTIVKLKQTIELVTKQ